MAKRCVLDPDVGPLYYDKNGKIIPYPKGRDYAASQLKQEFNRLNCSSPPKGLKKFLAKETPRKTVKASASKKAAQVKRPLPPVPKKKSNKVDNRSPVKSRASPPAPPSRPIKSKTKSHSRSKPPAPPSKAGKSKTPKIPPKPARKPPSRKVTEDKLLDLQKGNIAGNAAAQRRHQAYLKKR